MLEDEEEGKRFRFLLSAFFRPLGDGDEDRSDEFEGRRFFFECLGGSCFSVDQPRLSPTEARF